MLDWLTTHQKAIGLISLASSLLLLATVVATPWLLARLPSDYFTRTADHPAGQPLRRRGLVLLLRNALGILLILLGMIMFITPGPGLVAVIAGLSICSFSSKYRLLRSLARRPKVFASLNWMRDRAQHPPFEHPDR